MAAIRHPIRHPERPIRHAICRPDPLQWWGLWFWPPAAQVFRRTEIATAEDGQAVEQHTYARSLNLPAGIYEAELARYTLVPVEEYAEQDRCKK